MFFDFVFFSFWIFFGKLFALPSTWKVNRSSIEWKMAAIFFHLLLLLYLLLLFFFLFFNVIFFLIFGRLENGSSRAEKRANASSFRTIRFDSSSNVSPKKFLFFPFFLFGRFRLEFHQNFCSSDSFFFILLVFFLFLRDPSTVDFTWPWNAGTT